jgi:beta-N-acetylhexosaminidase
MSRCICLLAFLFCLPFSAAHGQSLQDKVGQMIMVGLPPTAASMDTLIVDIVDRNLGGVLMFAHNISSPEQIANLNAELQTYGNDHLLIAVDQEGGVVARLNQHNGYSATYTAQQLGEVFNSEDSTRAQAALMGGWLTDAGFNVNLAPVVDVNVYRDSPAIGRLNRSFSEDEGTVFEHASWYIDEFHEQNIITALKHFPGHGSARHDSHFGFTDISNTWQTRELYPFSELIKYGYDDMIMTGHLFKSDWDNQYPVSLSQPAITGVLRDLMGFEGVVISDELFMRAIQDHYGFDEAVVLAINAGTDILLFNTNIYLNQSLAGYVTNMVAQKVNEGEIEVATIDAAYDRIQNLKTRRLATDVETVADSGNSYDVKIRNYPNPFRHETVLEIEVPIPQRLTVEVFNTLGQRVQTLASGQFLAGTHRITFSPSRLSPGVYLVRVIGDDFRSSHRMTLVR